MATVTTHVFKLVAYQQTNLLTLQSISVGLALGPVMVFGSWLGKRIVRHLSTRVFVLIVELTLVLAGINFLLKA
ncbi:Sulfite exporter TauE/SafE [compost metagenome]